MSAPEERAGARVTLEARDAAATMRIGARLARILRAGDVLLLSGGLGAGKTTLTKGLVEELGGVPAEVTSPTFTLCRVYDTHPPVAHVDCWRLEQLAEVVDLALEEVLDAGGIVVVEWGEAAAPLLGAGALRAVLSGPGELAGDRRRIELVDESGRFAAAVAALAAEVASAGSEA